MNEQDSSVAAIGALEKIRVQGKTFFSRKENVALAEELARDPRNVETLIAGLNFEDNGLKQPCTTLALILKIGRRHRDESTVILGKALKNEAAPLHYLCELVYKINKRA